MCPPDINVTVLGGDVGYSQASLHSGKPGRCTDVPLIPLKNTFKHKLDEFCLYEQSREAKGPNTKRPRKQGETL